MGIQNEINRIKEGKEEIAQAITEKGIATNADVTFSQMSDNIRKLETSIDSTLIIPKGESYDVDFSANLSSGIISINTEEFGIEPEQIKIIYLSNGRAYPDNLQDMEARSVVLFRVQQRDDIFYTYNFMGLADIIRVNESDGIRTVQTAYIRVQAEYNDKTITINLTEEEYVILGRLYSVTIIT